MLHKTLLFIVLLSIFQLAFGQDSELQTTANDCKIILKGQVTDEHDSTDLEFAGVFVLEMGKGWSTDSNGIFEIKDFCPGTYTFRLSHVGCETRDTIIQIKENSFLKLNLEQCLKNYDYAKYSGYKVNDRDMNESFDLTYLIFK